MSISAAVRGGFASTVALSTEEAGMGLYDAQVLSVLAVAMGEALEAGSGVADAVGAVIGRGPR